MIDQQQLRQIVIKPTLEALSLYSQEAEDLMLGTCAIESRGGTYLKQLNGPALGIFQMEPRTHDDLWTSYLPNNPAVCNKMMRFCLLFNKPKAEVMVYHLTYACAMARILYARHKEPVPKRLEDQAEYYCKFYNSNLGKSTAEEYIAAYGIWNVKPAKGK